MIRFLLLLIVFSSSSYFIVKHNIANHYADEIHGKATADTLKKAKKWSPQHAYVLGKLASHYHQGGDAEKALHYAYRSLKNNPAYGLPTYIIADIADKNDQSKLADQAMYFTNRLWPTHVDARNIVAQYWARRVRFDKVIREWHIMLLQEHRLSPQIFPHLMSIASSEESRILLSPYIDSSWWLDFFSYVSQQKHSLSILKSLYQLRGKEVTRQETQELVAKLQANKEWSEAYKIWSENLSEQEKKYQSQFIYDGSFEDDEHGIGFKWYFLPSKTVNIKRIRTSSLSEGKSLQISFKRKERIDFQHIHQNMLIPAGKYRMSMQYRMSYFEASKGLKWRIRCIDGKNESVLGESKAFLGSSAWAKSRFDFNIDKSCKAQMLRLEATSDYTHEHIFSGDIWFDNITLQVISK